jgi:parallel beta-helix repeat protein
MAMMALALGLAIGVSPAANCYNNCSHIRITDGFMESNSGGKKVFVGHNWSAIQTVMPSDDIGPLPGLDANASTMRQLTLTGVYIADVPLLLPSRLHFRLDGSVQGDLNASTVPGGCPYGFQYHGRCSLIHIKGSKFVSVSGGTYTCSSGMTAFAISCEGCSNTLIQNLTASGCGQGNIHFFGAGAAIEIRNVDSSLSNRGVWSQTPSQKVLITSSFFHHNSADGVDLDSMSKNVMIRNNRFENNHRCGVFIEEGASDNIIVGNYFFNNTFGVGFYTNMGGKYPGRYPTKDNWVVGNNFTRNGGAVSLGGMKGNGATDTFIAENAIVGNGNSWGCNGALVGNHVLTSDTEDVRSARLLGYSSGNVTFFAEPPKEGNGAAAAVPKVAAAPASRKAFEVLWNSPTGGCGSCPDPAAQLSHDTVSKYQITANPHMAFSGNEVVLLYSCGLWPKLEGVYGGETPCWADGAELDNCTYTPFSDITATNGGVPQAGDVGKHAAAAAKALAAKAPATDFSGIVILDFEGWRPVAADNDAIYPAGYTLSLYTQYSRTMVKAAHPDWTEVQITAEATKQFDAAAQSFFTAAVVACKLTRPGSKVGYYGFPGMISPADTHPPSFAGPELLWLWRQLDVLAPSDYLWGAFEGHSVERAVVNVAMSLQLADLVANTTGVRPLVMPYIWIWPSPSGGLNGSSGTVRALLGRLSALSVFHSESGLHGAFVWERGRLNDKNGGFRPGQYGNKPARGLDLAASVTVPAAMGADGVILWGSSSDVHPVNGTSTCTLCGRIQTYLTADAGPAMAACVDDRQQCRTTECSGHGQPPAKPSLCAPPRPIALT